MGEVFTFNINEKISFQDQPLMKEMLGIGLEPVISIQELGESLSVRGVMELKGEYIQTDQQEVRAEELEYQGNKVERVEPISDETCEFFHKFIMDITIPMERIASMEDVAVEVDHFDYVLNSPGSINVEAVLAIHGLTEEAVIVERDPEEELVRYDAEAESDYSLREEEQFQFTVNQEANLQQEEDNVIPLTESSETTSESEEPVMEREEVHEENVWEESHREEVEQEEVVDEYEVEDEQSLEDDEREEEKIHVQGRSEGVDDTSYLLNIFSEEEEATSYSKLKLYIVQPEDQMHTIAERYDVSPRQIMRTNHLEDEDVTSGQLIYIPITSDE
ncbi:LysM peptidoglycan-binding domain-containing protein [Gracilibacillus dipsosauri]|uniref:LysM peptidoglycan-binding domain-containing protein n=1 Tax=Gracilibacillus dipsosauri TaxID=178340 RepID=UPI00240949B5